MEENQPETESGFKRVLGLPTGILLVAGIMNGSGVFKKIAPMSLALYSKPYILLAWIIPGIIIAQDGKYIQLIYVDQQPRKRDLK
jgi:APA family basic amino acid/polyamine antiporter